jgi:hypothetical protein
VQLVYQEYERHTNKVIELQAREDKALKDTAEKYEKARIKEKEDASRVEIENRNRTIEEKLKILEKEYDELSEMDRQSDYGKKLKY